MQAEELRRKNQVLEEETVAQRHIIHLEKIKTEKESRELKEQKNRLMSDLEQEKQRLEEDILKLNRNRVRKSCIDLQLITLTPLHIVDHARVPSLPQRVTAHQ